MKAEWGLGKVVGYVLVVRFHGAIGWRYPMCKGCAGSLVKRIGAWYIMLLWDMQSLC